MEENRKLIEKSDLVLLERFHIGPGNMGNLKAALEALEKGKKVIVLENNLEYDSDKNYSDPPHTVYYLLSLPCPWRTWCPRRRSGQPSRLRARYTRSRTRFTDSVSA
jgi:hypothetical protein